MTRLGTNDRGEVFFLDGGGMGYWPLPAYSVPEDHPIRKYKIQVSQGEKPPSTSSNIALFLFQVLCGSWGEVTPEVLHGVEAELPPELLTKIRDWVSMPA